MIDAVILFDVYGRITMANKAAESLFLVREDGLVGKFMPEINSDLKINQMIDDVLINGNEVFTEIEMSSNNQTYRLHVAPIKNEQLRIEGAVAVFHDVTDARNFDQMRSQFVGNVSHELRTPLTSIKGFVETLLDGAMENSATCRRFLSIIDAETDRLSRLIEDLLTLSSIESKERVINPVPVCIQHSVRTVMNILGPQISEKGLHVE
ncbi:MAG: PAS domain-containing protein, partial [Syntrophomonadaceae bacterium]|nr:PAS domain-containing protein [Syntrophomonadaceae bacterium]